MKNMALLQCEHLVIGNEDDSYSQGELNLTAEAGEIISIIGPSRDINSNCLKTLSCVIETESGHLDLAGKSTKTLSKEDWIRMRTQFAYIHADTAILSAANALQNLMLPAMYHKTGEANELRKKAQQLLVDIEAGDKLELLPAYLTKEQRYKIAVARAMMLDPSALMLDSPFTRLDLSTIHQFKQFLLNTVRNNNLLLILVTHDTKFALEHSDQIIYISKQKILIFNKNNRIQDCQDQEVCSYLKHR